MKFDGIVTFFVVFAVLSINDHLISKNQEKCTKMCWPYAVVSCEVGEIFSSDSIQCINSEMKVEKKR